MSRLPRPDDLSFLDPYDPLLTRTTLAGKIEREEVCVERVIHERIRASSTEWLMETLEKLVRHDPRPQSLLQAVSSLAR